MSESAPDLSKLRIDRTLPRRRHRGILPIVLLVLAGALWAGWRQFFPADARPVVEVGRARRVGGYQAQQGVAANGYVVARKQAALSTDIQGRIVELPVEEGDRVEAGDLVARLDTAQLEAALARWEAEAARSSAERARALAGEEESQAEKQRVEAVLASAEAERQEAEAAELLAQREFDRVRPLVESGDMSRSLLDEAESALEQAAAKLRRNQALYRVAQAQLAHAEARIRQALAQSDVWAAAERSSQAQHREVAVMIEKSSVRAPFAGVITRKNAEVGEVVSAIGATGPNARGAVATLVDFATLEVQVELAQTSLGVAREQAPVLIFLDAFPENAYRGRVRQIWPTADRQKATVELRCEFVERDEHILPEMGVRIVFVEEDARIQAPEVFVPEAAVVDGEPARVFLFESGLAVLRAIEIDGEAEDGLLRIRDGLDGNELVILDPPASLQDGDEVRRQESGT